MKKRNNFLLWFCFFAVAGFLSPGVSFSAPPVSSPAAPAAPPATASPLIFHYNPTGKPDPFKPFVDAEIALKKKQAEQQKKKQQALPLSPLQRLPLESFKLVGIAGNPQGRKAMVQDVNGKFYPLFVGTYIGLNRAKVVAIRETSVFLEEAGAQGSGKKAKKKTIEMKLRREGDEGKP